MNVASTILKLLMAMALGFYMRKKGVIDHKANQALSFIVINAAAPLLAITSVEHAAGDKSSLFKFMGIGILLYLFLPFLGKFVAKALRAPKEDEIVYEMSIIFSNNVFMGFPVISAIFGQIAIFYSYIFHIMFNFMYYSYGIHLITKDKLSAAALDSDGNPLPSTGSAEKKKSLSEKIKSLKGCINNGTIAALISLTMFLLNLHLPHAVNDVMNFIGNLATPISMISIGASIASYPLASLFSDKKIISLIPIRLILMPAIGYFLMTFTGFDGMLRGIVTVTLGMPIASVVSMGCTEYDCHEKEASAAVAASTLLSILTIPVMMLLFS